LLSATAALSCNALTNIGDYEVQPTLDSATGDAAPDAADSGATDVDAGVDAGPTVEIIATGQAQPGAIAVDDDYVYWLNFGRKAHFDEGALLNCAVGTNCGSKPNALAAGRSPPGAMVLDSGTITFTTTNKGGSSTGAIERCPAKSPVCVPAKVRDGEDNPVGIAQSGENLLWSVLGGSMRRCSTSVACSDAAAFYTKTVPIIPVATDGTQIFFAETLPAGGRVLSCFLVSCTTATTLATGQRSVFNMIESGGRLFWTEYVTDGRVLSIRTDGSETTPVVIADLQNKPAGVARDLSDLYWANRGNGTIMHGKVDKGSGTPDVHLSGLESPNSVTVHDGWIYVTAIGADDTVAGGTVFRVRK